MSVMIWNLCLRNIGKALRRSLSAFVLMFVLGAKKTTNVLVVLLYCLSVACKESEKIKKIIEGKDIVKIITIPKKLVNIVIKG